MNYDECHAFLIFDLLQDVNILWRVAQLIARETDCKIGLLVSDKFVDRDASLIWGGELAELAAATGAEIHRIDSEFAAYSICQGKRGVIIAGSESDLNAHSTSHNIFRSAPISLVRITLQHGYECVGFLQNREQSMAHGEDIRFAADIVCSWMGEECLRHLRPSERSKLFVSGPSTLIDFGDTAISAVSQTGQTGLVCENLHSVRMNAAGDLKPLYMDTFFGFATVMDRMGRSVAMRPHPGGQYVVRNNIELPKNVVLNNSPMYKVDLSQYAYGISAPSSVLIDMVLAGIPTAVWHDGASVIDASSYEGLTRISTLDEWVEFANRAISDPGQFIESQQRFLKKTGILTDRAEIHRRFLGLITAACNDQLHDPGKRLESRVLYIANAELPTLQLGFFKPLQPLVDGGEIACQLITEAEIRRQMGKVPDEAKGKSWLEGQINSFRPDIAVFCRYSGPLSDWMIYKLRAHDVPIIFHIDDDLLHVPREIGEAKFREHNRPERRGAITNLLNGADLVYCSTLPLMKRFNELGFKGNLKSGDIYCSATILAPAVERVVRKVGYMGFDHAHDLELALPQLVRFLRERPDINFELFGSIPKPAALDEFGERVTVIPPVRPYSSFLDHFAGLEWDIGICPLAATEFNVVKANTKWVEYSSVGAAVVATANMAYDDCCSDGSGVLIEGENGWLEALHRLSADPKLRYRMVCNAQEKLRNQYSVERLQNQVLTMFDLAQKKRKTAA